MTRAAKSDHLRVRVSDDEKRRWEEAAARAGNPSVSEWIRQCLNAAIAAEAGGVDPDIDLEYGDALDRLRIRGGHRRPADAIRSAVVTFRGLLDEAGIDPVELLDRTRKALPGASAKKR